MLSCCEIDVIPTTRLDSVKLVVSDVASIAIGAVCGLHKRCRRGVRIVEHGPTYRGSVKIVSLELNRKVPVSSRMTTLNSLLYRHISIDVGHDFSGAPATCVTVEVGRNDQVNLRYLADLICSLYGWRLKHYAVSESVVLRSIDHDPFGHRR